MMRDRRPRVIALFVVLLTTGFGFCEIGSFAGIDTVISRRFTPIVIPLPQGQSSTADADSTAIKQVVANYSSALNRRDAHAAAMCFAEDADFVDTTGESAHGRQEIEKFFVSALAGRLKTAKRKDVVRSIRFLTPEIAAEENEWEVTGATASDGSGTISTFKGRHAWVMTKENGQWFITVFHGMRLPS